MENGIKILTTNIENETNTLIKDNNFLINAFEVRLLKRILFTFNKYKIPFNKDKLDNITSEYLIMSFKDVNKEVCISYKRLLYKYFDIINEYYNTHEDSKDKIKSITKNFISKLYNKENPILNKKLSNNYINELRNIIYVYDNINLNKDIESIIKNDTIDIIKELNRNINEYLVKIMKDILTYIIKGEE